MLFQSTFRFRRLLELGPTSDCLAGQPPREFATFIEHTTFNGSAAISDQVAAAILHRNLFYLEVDAVAGVKYITSGNEYRRVHELLNWSKKVQDKVPGIKHLLKSSRFYLE